MQFQLCQTTQNNGCSSTLTDFSVVFNLFSLAPSRPLSSTATLPSSRFTYNKVCQKNITISESITISEYTFRRLLKKINAHGNTSCSFHLSILERNGKESGSKLKYCTKSYYQVLLSGSLRLFYYQHIQLYLIIYKPSRQLWALMANYL